MTLRCEQVFALLSDYLDGELSAETRAAFESHISGCTMCSRFGAEFSAIIDALRGSARPTMSHDLAQWLEGLDEPSA